MKRAIIIAGALAVFLLALVADYAFGNTIYMPNVQQAKREPTVVACDPCLSSTPYPPTATPFVGEPPMPTMEVAR